MNFFKNLASLAGGYGGAATGAMSGFLGQKPSPVARLDAGGATPLPPSNNPWWQPPVMPKAPDLSTYTPDPNMSVPLPGRGTSLDGSYQPPPFDDHGVSYINWMRQKQGLPPMTAEEQGWGTGSGQAGNTPAAETPGNAWWKRPSPDVIERDQLAGIGAGWNPQPMPVEQAYPFLGNTDDLIKRFQDPAVANWQQGTPPPPGYYAYYDPQSGRQKLAREGEAHLMGGA